MNDFRLRAAAIRQSIAPRPTDAHKGTAGHALIVAGSRGMNGAAILCALGGLRAGAGLVSVAIPQSERSAMNARIPEALTLLLPEDADGYWTPEAIPRIDSYMRDRHVKSLAIGPGLSVRPAVQQLVFHALRDWSLPLVLDADGLNAIQAEDLHGRAGLVITPHPGEFARLFKLSEKDVARSRATIAQQMARQHGVVCVLKGHESVISDGNRVRINPTGHAAMAAGGMGDVLTGVIAALLAQGMAPFEAACAGVYVHGLSADLRATSDRGLLASDVADGIPAAFQKIGVR